ncbi:MAG: riboflavin biosynthesis protein RibF [Calditrichaeota bacterium]|nr:riboflavin biosynthesis protein RibF [Calditrichota bacterium]
MEVVRGLENVKAAPGALVTVGSYDGLHIGHQRIIRSMRRHRGGPITLITFEPHPQRVVRPDFPPPPQLTTLDERIALFEKSGVKRLVLIKFDAAFSELTAERFVKDVLLGRIGMGAIFVGPGHRFGRGREGDVELLGHMGRKFSFSVEVVPPVVRQGAPVSSSRIRKTLLSGDARRAFEWLSRPYFLSGKVIKGDGRGRGLGFPTANLTLAGDGKLIPPPGIYASVAEWDNLRWPSATHIGPRPTYPDAAPSVESYLIGFAGDLYGRSMRIGLVSRLRDIVAFDSPTQLSQQMKRDVEDAQKTLAAEHFGSSARLRARRFLT